MRRLSAAGTLACLLYAAPATESVRFEPRPRAVSAGRDPVIHVRASGAVSLLKVDGGNLYLETSHDGGDSFEEPVRVNSTDGEVSSHGESSPRMAIRSRGEFYVLWQARKQGGEASELHFARSTGWGESFTKSIVVDPTSPSQSFFNLALSPQGIVYAAWLDGRDRGEGKAGSSAVYLARSVNKGVSFEPAVRVSLDSCPLLPALDFLFRRKQCSRRLAARAGGQHPRHLYIHVDRWWEELRGRGARGRG